MDPDIIAGMVGVAVLLLLIIIRCPISFALLFIGTGGLIYFMGLVPAMLERGGGTVINMTSSAALTDPPGPLGRGGWGFAYAASKSAFHRMAGILQVEFGNRGVRAYNVNPGYVVTEAMRALFGEKNDLAEAHRGAPPEVPAAVIAWLASDPQAYGLAGQTINAQRLCKERDLLPGWPA